MSAPAVEEGAASARGTFDARLGVIVAAVLLVLLLSPSRLYVLPFGYAGSYLSYSPPNVVDLLWLGLLGLLALQTQKVPVTALVAGGLLLLIGVAGTALMSEGTAFEPRVDLVLFNLRVFAALGVGALLARSRPPTLFLPLLLVGGTAVVALSSIFLLVRGGFAYQLYAGMGRFGAIGFAPNEAALTFAAMFNMVALLARRRPWLALTAPVFLAGIAATGSRTGVLVAAIGLVLFIPLVFRTLGGTRRAFAWAVVVVILGATVWWLALQLQRFIAQEAVASVAGRLQTTGTDVSWLFRLDLYGAVWSYLAGHPVALAIGIGGSNGAVERWLTEVLSFGTAHAHSIVLQFLAAYGVAGLGVWTWLGVRALRAGAAPRHSEDTGLRLALATLLLAQLAQYALWEEKMLLVMVTIMGYLAAGGSGTPQARVEESQIGR